MAAKIANQMLDNFRKTTGSKTEGIFSVLCAVLVPVFQEVYNRVSEYTEKSR